MKKILLVFGTRPEAIKMLPVAKCLARETEVQTLICVTGQHREMLDQVLSLFDARPDYDLDIMRRAQGLEHITTAVLTGVAQVIDQVRPDRILVHGDTTTAMAASLAAFYRKVPVGHVEAGLRSGDIGQPWPEEANRRIVSVVTDLHFAPTARARDNLLAEGVSAKSIHITGNTVIDALRFTVDRLRGSQELETTLASRFDFLEAEKPILLVTGHRRENFGSPFHSVCEAIRDLAGSGRMQVVYPVHLNPNVMAPVNELLGSVPGVHLIEPLDYVPFVYLMQKSHAILTDSGGIQEEGPSLGKPVFVMRNVTERPEALAAGAVRLVGTDRGRIVSEVLRMFREPDAYDEMCRAHNPYGDGRAASRIADVLVGREVKEFNAVA
ncbi:UDP-N-acetylglucosamine 2-epimerase (non-hydrolyzing) [Aquibium carbonis]|uniref:UDP-N-acetylglucosamine 2-epimerase (non-hydrolyzing) n=1 Tax=Aquibium carbonis TaxID=2495581 RepID=A0A3S0A6U3_9HYPH|nr:UDP-N-acetylglucosamine 2-epimerase (non-hydrolyzing) [Aquibium carbonis]RST85173.1 UDP-N-acetylglucosamine 2-epimerase (non-hydrolyzing) [Aquibium carbonis]